MNPLARPDATAAAFARAKPFPHLVLDGFLGREAALALAAEFPRSEDLSWSGDAQYGRRGCRRSLTSCGPAFRALEEALSSPAFLASAAALAGVPSLARDPEQRCGGLFQDAHGLDLDPHLDANATFPGMRRRLTLLYYLNTAWNAAWGGALRLHAGPEAAPAVELPPLFDRAVLLACREDAWHSVSGIRLPSARRARGRRALIVNFYAPARAGDAPAHHNIWLPPPPALPAGPLRAAHAAALRRLLARRDALLAGLGDAARRPPLPPLPTGRGLRPSEAARLKALFAGRDRALRRRYALAGAAGERP